MSFFGSITKALKDIAGVSNKEDDARKKALEAQAAAAMKNNIEVRKRMDGMRPRKSVSRGRGRDSTIITQNAGIQSRTLLG